MQQHVLEASSFSRVSRPSIVRNGLPLSVGGGIGESRTLMLTLRNTSLGEVTVSAWPKILKEMCAKKNILRPGVISARSPR